MFNKAREREKVYEELVANYKAQIVHLESALKEKKTEYVVVRPPQENDLREYNRQIAEFVKNPFYLSYFETLKREIVGDFAGNGRNTPDYYRGKLNLIGQIFKDARDAELIHVAINEKEAEKVENV